MIRVIFPLINPISDRRIYVTPDRNLSLGPGLLRCVWLFVRVLGKAIWKQILLADPTLLILPPENMAESRQSSRNRAVEFANVNERS